MPLNTTPQRPPEPRPSPARGSWRTLAEGEVLYQRGDRAEHAFFVRSGLLMATLDTSSGRQRIPDLYLPGDLLGGAALEPNRYFETVVSLRRSGLEAIAPADLAADADLRAAVALGLTSQLRRRRERAGDDGLPVGARVGRVLLQLVVRSGARTPDDISLFPELTHDMLAGLVGASRVTVTRVIGELREREAIEGGRGRYVVHPQRLERAIDAYILSHL